MADCLYNKITAGQTYDVDEGSATYGWGTDPVHGSILEFWVLWILEYL